MPMKILIQIRTVLLNITRYQEVAITLRAFMEDLLTLGLFRFLTTSIQPSLVIQNQVSKVEFIHLIPELVIAPLAVTHTGSTLLVIQVQAVALTVLIQQTRLIPATFRFSVIACGLVCYNNNQIGWRY